MDDVVQINPGLSIPRSELTYKATRAGGPGGQHVNTSSTRVELWWDVSNSPSLNDAQRARITEKLGKRISDEGFLKLASAVERSQHQNKEEVTSRFARMIDQALKVPKPRKKTKPSKASKQKRLDLKKRQSDKKKNRGKVDLD